MVAHKVEISYKTIVFTTIFLLGLWFLYQTRQIITLVFVSLVLMSSFNPLVDQMEKLRIPRPLGIAATYLGVLLLVVLIAVGIAPLVVAQTILFSQRIPEILHQFELLGVGRETLGVQLGQLWSVPLDLLRVTVDIFSNLLNFVVVAAVTFYLLLERKKLDQYLTALFDPDGQKQARTVVDQLEKKLGSWVRGEIILMTTVGLMSFLGFKALGIEFALPLGVLAGILEIIPNVGPIIAALVAVVAGFSISPAIAAAALAWAFIVQQIEAHILVPKVMQSATGVHPIISIIALLVGLKLGGTAGAILAIPIVLTVDVLVREYLLRRGVFSS